jgi:hypothetical protein
MTKLFKILSSDYNKLQKIIILFVIVVCLVKEVIYLLFFHKNLLLSSLDLLITLTISIILIKIGFSLIKQKEKQLKYQIDQLTDSYQYIGKINRKIDSLLELDISSLDHSKKNISIEDSAKKIFSQLINSVSAKAGLLVLYSPLNLKIYQQQNNNGYKKILEKLASARLPNFCHSQNQQELAKFTELNFEDSILKKYILVSKPVYMHDKDIGIITLVFDNNFDLEERDLNIVRVFSFYLALNVTFQPDFNLKKI